MQRHRFLAILLAALALRCVEDKSNAPHPPRRAEHGDRFSAARIGFGDGAVPQVHLPVREYPPQVSATPVALSGVVSLAPMSDGGALIAWTQSRTAPPTSDIYLRHIDASAATGPTWRLRTVRGIVRGIAVAASDHDALVVWSADFGGVAAQIHAQRVRFDGTMLGADFGIGTFRVVPPNADGGAAMDRIGHYVAVASIADHYVVALRGPIIACRGMSTTCETVRVAEIDRYNGITGHGGVDDPQLAPPVVLAAGPSVDWSLVVTTGVDTSNVGIAGFGPGPLHRLAGHPGGALRAAWIENDQPYALVERLGAGGRAALAWVDANDADGGAGSISLLSSETLGCDANVPTVTLRSARGVRVVHANDPGASSVFVHALSTSRARGGANETSTVALTRGGLLEASAAGVRLQACSGTALTPPTAIAWDTGAPAAVTPSDH